MPAPLSQAIQDYLKAIYLIAQDKRPVTTTELAERLDFSPASVTNMMKRLARMRLVHHTPYHGVALTDTGGKVALEIIRHHRLLELYLSRQLGVSLDRVHGEADRLEHVISEELEERIALALGEPALDPHGDPIPTKAGELIQAEGRVLTEATPGQRGVITRVSDRDARQVRELAAAGLLPGAEVEVVSTGSRVVNVLVEGQRQRISAALAEAVYLDAEDQAPVA